MTSGSCQAVSSSPWSDAAVIATAAGAVVFVASYAWTTRGAWRRSSVGRNVMSLMSAIMVVAGLAVAAIIWGTDWSHRELVRTVAWLSIAVPIWWRVAILFRVQHRRRNPGE
jgi:hypothetical protein